MDASPLPSTFSAIIAFLGPTGFASLGEELSRSGCCDEE